MGDKVLLRLAQAISGDLVEHEHLHDALLGRSFIIPTMAAI
jgi:hypothetical protein